VRPKKKLLEQPVGDLNTETSSLGHENWEIQSCWEGRHDMNLFWGASLSGKDWLASSTFAGGVRIVRSVRRNADLG
jgi:hypothetical protein